MYLKHWLLAAAIGAVSIRETSAQNKLSIENIRSISLRNSGTIVSGEEIKGYFYYYVSDKVDRKIYEYTIQILDENLKEVNRIVFEDDKRELLLETSFNGSSLLFLFFNRKEEMVTTKVYGLDGKLKATYSKPLDKRSAAYFASGQASLIGDEEGANQYIYDLDQKGFLSVIPLRDGKDYSFEIDIVHSDKKKAITFTPDYADYKYATAAFLGYSGNIALFEILKKQKLMSNKLEGSLLGVDVNSGKKVFELDESATKYKFMPIGVSALNGTDEILLLGNYYDQSDKVVKNNTLGIGAVTIDSKGKIKSQQYNSWATDFSKYLDVNEKGKLDDIGYLYFHKLIQTEDGEIFAVSEGYKRTASGMGIAMNVLAAASGGYSNASVTKLTITDLLLIRFTNQFKVKDVQVYEKNKNRFELPGADFATPHMLAAVAKSFGAFDYEFTRTDASKSNFYIGYNDYERKKDFKGLVFNSISYVDGKLSTDRLPLKSEASKLRVMPAKAGSILISEYFKKSKRLDIRMEKLN